MADDPGPLGPGSRELDLRASDGTALRGAFLRSSRRRGVVLLLQGRTEFLEKYVDVAAAFASRGFSVASVDWRGQGGSARATADPLLGHVDDFSEYQRDLAALRAATDRFAQGLPRVIVAHSMGGAIGLRGLLRDETLAERAIFTAPMWGLAQPRLVETLARGLARAAAAIGLGRRYALGGGREPYVFGRFEGNVLTGDRASWDALAEATRRAGDRALAGPSWAWLRAAYAEIDALAGAPRTPAPCLVVVGSEEAVTDPDAMRARARLSDARLAVIDGARHEPFIETPERREALWRAIDDFLSPLED